jgi:hypothetical protein
MMKNKLVKTLSLGIACFMFSVLLSAYTPQSNAIALATIPTNKTIIVPCQDPPFH